MVKNLLFIKMFVMTAFFASAQTVDITFEVNAANTNDANGMYIAGGTAFGGPGDNAMTDADGDGVWTITITKPLNTSSHWTILNDNCPDWSCKENIAGQSCSDPDNFNDRWLPRVTQDTTIKTCYGECSTDGSCSTPKDQIDLPITWEGNSTNYTVTDFGNNMSELVEDPTDASNTVLKSTKLSTAQTWAGTTLSTNDGLANAIPITAENTIMSVDVYSPDAGTPVRFKIEDASDPTKSVETEVNTTKANEWETLIFDFSNEAPNTAELNPSYTFDKASIFYNFGTTGADAGEKVYYCDNIIFGTEEDPIMLMFQVDMTEYSEAFTNVYLSGAFNGWCDNCAQMTDDNDDNIYEVSVEFTQPGEIEYKFQLDSWNAEEKFEGGETCTKTTGEFTNRVYMVESSDTLDVMCWQSCDACTSVGIDQSSEELSIYPNPANNMLFVQVNEATNNVSLLNSQGQVVSVKNATNNTLSFDVSNMASGIYFVRLQQDDNHTIKKIVIE